MTLNVRKAGPEEYGHSIKILIGGHPGSGKTRMCSTAPGVVWAATGDAGLMSVVDRKVPFIEVDQIKALQEMIVALQLPKEARNKEFGFDVKTVVVDTTDGVQRLLIEERLKETKKEQLAIQDFGWLGDQMRSIVRAFRNLPLHVIFTVHLRTREDDTGTSAVVPALQGALQDELAAHFDLAVLLRATPMSKVVDGKVQKVLVRSAQTAPDSRYPWLKDRSGKLPMDFEVNFNDDFERMYRSIFGNLGTVEKNSASVPASARS